MLVDVKVDLLPQRQQQDSVESGRVKEQPVPVHNILVGALSTTSRHVRFWPYTTQQCITHNQVIKE